MEYQPGISNPSRTALIFTLLFVAVFSLHIPLLHLPYFWDEAGYYVPAARDLWLAGSLIPHSTPSNAHPPLVMAYLALCWTLAGYAPVVTRTAMLLAASFSLLGVFRLAQRVANFEVAVAATLCTGLYPVFFAQSSLAHVDLAAAGITFWGWSSYLAGKRAHAALWFSLAALAKETALLVPLALFAWELLCPLLKSRLGEPACEAGLSLRRSLWMLIPCLPLALWYLYHYGRTGYIFGNPEFFRYNVESTLQPLRIVLALLLRLWQTFGYLNLYFLTLAMLLAMGRSPLQDREGARPGIALRVQYAFLAVAVVYVLAMAMVGGAVLARYMLPVVPLVIIVAVSTLRRRVRAWRMVVAIVVLAFAAGLFINPPYGFSPEDNLAYRDYVVLHQRAEDFLEARYSVARVLTAWPASDELTRPYLGYVTRPMRVFRIEDFTAEEVMSASEAASDFDVAFVFSTKCEPPHPWFERWRTWQQWKARFFSYHRDLPPEAAAQILGGRLVYRESLRGQWVGVIEMDRIYNASLGHEMAGVRLDHQPDRVARLQLK